MSDSIAQQLAELPQLKRLALQERWKKLFCFDPSSEMRRDFMIPILAYRIQEQAFGSLSPQTEKRLRELARKIECSPTRPITDRQALKPGTRLVRQWGRGQHRGEQGERDGGQRDDDQDWVHFVAHWQRVVDVCRRAGRGIGSDRCSERGWRPRRPSGSVGERGRRIHADSGCHRSPGPD